MRTRDPYLNPLRNFNLTDEYWSSVLHNLIKESHHESQLIKLVEESPFTESFDLDSDSFTIFSSDTMSLNEIHSKRKVTPYHLSFFKKTRVFSKSMGQFFTPSYISQFIANRTLDSYIRHNQIKEFEDVLPTIKIADIASGTGNLLIAILYAIYEKLQPLNDSKRRSFLKFLTDNVYAFDLDSFALFIQKLRVLLFSSLVLPNFDLPDLDRNFQVGNSLLEDNSLSEIFSIAAFQPIEILTQPAICTFDLIVSNPPYMSYGLRNAQKFQPQFKDYLRKRFKSAQYKLSLYPVFIERSIELLKEGGVLGIITPDSHLLGRYYSNLREYMLSEVNILDITVLGFEPFKGVTLGRPTITFMQKKGSGSRDLEDKPFPTRWISSLTNFLKEDWEDFLNSPALFHESEYKRFYLYFNLQDKQFVEKWREKARTKLAQIVTMHTGVRAKIGNRNIVSKTNRGASWKEGVISSSQIHPFHIEYQNDWINIQPSILWSGGFNKEKVESLKIILRQTGDKIIAAVDNQGYYHLNNCHTISPIDPNLNLYALTTQLNSIEFNKVYNILSMEKGRALAQVDMDFLLQRFVITTTEKQDSILEEFYWDQNKNQQGKNAIEECYLFDLLDQSLTLHGTF